MAFIAQALNQGSFAQGYGSPVNIDLESGHRVLNMLMESLQKHFKADTNYERPLMSPQANIVFALDAEVAMGMMTYMSRKLRVLCGFDDNEFRFSCKSGANGEMLQRLRLEFPNGVNANVIHKLMIALDRLESADTE